MIAAAPRPTRASSIVLDFGFGLILGVMLPAFETGTSRDSGDVNHLLKPSSCFTNIVSIDAHNTEMSASDHHVGLVAVDGTLSWILFDAVQLAGEADECHGVH